MSEEARQAALAHFGVPGMKWGHRKDRRSTARSGRSPQTTETRGQRAGRIAKKTGRVAGKTALVAAKITAGAIGVTSTVAVIGAGVFINNSLVPYLDSIALKTELGNDPDFHNTGRSAVDGIVTREGNTTIIDRTGSPVLTQVR